ncbi:MAG: type II toxin-antitoxin system VapB family antitoxin [Hyphomicrobiales bacterium]
MGIFIKDPATDKAVRKLAKRRGVTLTEAIRSAVLKDLGEGIPGDEDAALKKLQDKFASYPDTGLKADKALYDSLYED